mmetsp:Transcript_6028/g.18926  ORF Transcript_6028/g.18926 Transcript_6028/m.18926 type:complete len:183 (+) Transcript_6028:273-821(+)
MLREGRAHPDVNNVIGIDRVGAVPCAMLEWCQTHQKKAPCLEHVGDDPFLRRTVIDESPAYERIRLAFELASALRFLHLGNALGSGVRNRDVKPANAGIDANGKLELLDAFCKEGTVKEAPQCTASLGRHSLGLRFAETSTRRWCGHIFCCCSFADHGIIARVVAAPRLSSLHSSCFVIHCI